MRITHCHVAIAAIRLAALLAAPGAAAAPVDYDAAEALFGEPVTLSVTGSPLRASEAPANLVIITQAEIRHLGADTLFDILKTVPGIDVHQSSIIGGDAAIHGYNQQFNPRLLLLIDGVPFYNDYVGSTDLANIPIQLAEIRQIEIVKTPSSALFGFDALCGVINIVTYDPKTHPVNQVSVHAGTQALAEESAVATANLAGIGAIRLSAGAFRADEFAPPPGNTAPIAHPFMNQLDAQAHVALGNLADLVLQAGYAADRDTTDDQFASTFDTRTNEQRANLSIPTNYGDVSLAAWRRESIFNAISDETTGTTRKWDVNGNWLIKLGSAHTLRIGTEFARTSISSPELDFQPGFIGDTDAAVSIMWRWQIAERLSLTSAARLDDFWTSPGRALNPLPGAPAPNRHLIGLSFNSGIVWQPTVADTLRLTASRGLQLPSLDGLISQFRVEPGVYTLAAQNLQPVAVTSIEAGEQRSIDAIAGHLSASMFVERNDNLIDASLILPASTQQPVYINYTNAGHSFAAGAELTADGSITPAFTWNAWYAFIAIQDRLSRVPGVAGFTQNNHGTPRHSAYLRADYHVGRFGLGAGARWQSSFLTPTGGNAFVETLGRVPSYLSVDARAAWRVAPPLTLDVTVLQALRSAILESGGTAVDRRVLAGATWTFR